MNFLNRYLWKTDPISNPALQYGIKRETVARNSYNSLKHSDRAMAVESGYWVSSTYSELACSPNEFIIDHDEPTVYGILEIKCPKSKENEIIPHFNEKLKKKKTKKIFFLETNDENRITLKRTQVLLPNSNADANDWILKNMFSFITIHSIADKLLSIIFCTFFYQNRQTLPSHWN